MDTDVAEVESLWQIGPTGVMPGLVGEPTTGLAGLVTGDWWWPIGVPRLIRPTAHCSGGRTAAIACAVSTVKSEWMLGNRVGLGLCRPGSAGVACVDK